jgi:hypothetical protein
MPKSKSKPVPPAPSAWDSQVRLLLWLATCVSIFSFLFYYRNGQILLYGDAVAHINIARRVFDSKTPGLLQLGTVWLPLPHLLMIPFLISKRMWQTGAGGSIPSMAAYVFGVVGIFRLVRALPIPAAKPHLADFAAWTAALIYAANPNLLYLQSTAMGEALYLAFFVWALVYLRESIPSDQKALTKSGLCVAAACLTRYDGWLLAAAMAATVVVARIVAGRAQHQDRPRWCPAAGRFVLIAAAAPALWLAYNGIVYRNPLEFENGPYSAKAIEQRSQSAANPGHPGSGNPFLASLYFIKSAEENIAQNRWLERIWLLLVAIGVGLAAIPSRPNTNSAIAPKAAPGWPLLFLLVPLPFYALSVAYGGVPMFVPAFWPFTHYNVRYGLQLLPAFAAGFGALMDAVLRFRRWSTNLRLSAALTIFALLCVSYISIWRDPICLQEGEINMRSRNHLEAQLASLLKTLPPDATLLMYLGDHVGALERAGIPLRHVINEGNHRVWKQPFDSSGLWERALANPSQYADYVVASEGDPVWQAVHGKDLKALIDLHVSGQAPVILYRAR